MACAGAAVLVDHNIGDAIRVQLDYTSLWDSLGLSLQAVV